MAMRISVLEEALNCPVVQVSSRRYPGMIIQGDTLFSFFRLVQETRKTLAAGKVEKAADYAEQLEDALGDLLAFYENVLKKHGCMLPYFRGAGGEDNEV
jgi:hypothetical protein